MHTLLGFTADEWSKVIASCGTMLSVAVGGAAFVYARLAAKRSKAAVTGADDAVEAAGRAETAAAGGTSDLSAEVAELRRLMSSRLPSVGAAAVAARAARRPATLDDAAAVATRDDPRDVPTLTPGAAVTPQDEAPGTITPAEAPEAPEAPAGPATLDTQAVWQVLGGRRA